MCIAWPAYGHARSISAVSLNCEMLQLKSKLEFFKKTHLWGEGGLSQTPKNPKATGMLEFNLEPREQTTALTSSSH